jgi:hypothetical protein
MVVGMDDALGQPIDGEVSLIHLDGMAGVIAAAKSDVGNALTLSSKVWNVWSSAADERISKDRLSTDTLDTTKLPAGCPRSPYRLLNPTENLAPLVIILYCMASFSPFRLEK